MVNGRGRLSLAQLQKIHAAFRQLNEAQLADLLVQELQERAKSFIAVGNMDVPEPQTTRELLEVQEGPSMKEFQETVEAVMLMATTRAVTLETLTRLGDRFQAQVSITPAMPVKEAIKHVRRRANR